ncbi:GH1 family beta-glucosidase [Paraferrimonas sp. SM1919]|uniref:GH1 family beta-glucosidase n=1 Tax=Paraferrimonas sp. SM1919 TaxID=2662263 RepID=UPI0013CF4CB2|nr:GH1 family beta-glucosidase [Paraferrimonas sp. SM1919]
MQTFNFQQNSPLLAPDFTFGVATASFQIEGHGTGRLPCIWDTFCAKEGTISDKSDGTIACDHYNKWPQDIELIDGLGMDAYRLSLSWPRLTDENNQLKAEGVEFYKNILKELKTKNIKTFVTLYHWDLPQWIEEQGGWLNRNTAYLFAEYAALVAKELAPWVDSFATLNEPFCSSYLGYEVGIHAPGLTGQAKGRAAAHHLLLGHGLAMTELQKYAPDAMNGIVLNFTPAYSASESEADKQAASYADDYFNQWYIKPIFDGEYPAIIEQLPADVRPPIEAGDMDIISQSVDFLGINYYTRAIYQACPDNIYKELPAPEPTTAMGWEIYPQAFGNLLIDLNKRYQLPPVYITENGCASFDEIEGDTIHDKQRLDYYQSHLEQVERAISAGVDIQGYFAWSLMDNFEWALGYSRRFGIVYVDYDNNQKRYLKDSAKAFAELNRQRKA